MLRRHAKSSAPGTVSSEAATSPPVAPSACNCQANFYEHGYEDHDCCAEPEYATCGEVRSEDDWYDGTFEGY